LRRFMTAAQSQPDENHDDDDRESSPNLQTHGD
jgi:hypothetical protein